MSCFDRFFKRENLISKSLNIDEELYNKLEGLSKNVYDASISKLINATIEKLIKDEDIRLYDSKNRSYVYRSVLIKESLVDGLENLKDKYRISISLLVNISIRNVLMDEKVI